MLPVKFCNLGSVPVHLLPVDLGWHASVMLQLAVSWASANTHMSKSTYVATYVNMQACNNPMHLRKYYNTCDTVDKNTHVCNYV